MPAVLVPVLLWVLRRLSEPSTHAGGAVAVQALAALVGPAWSPIVVHGVTLAEAALAVLLTEKGKSHG